MRLKFVFTVVAGVLAASAVANANSMTGNTVSCATNTPPSTYTCSAATHVVGAGNEFTIGPSGVGAMTVNFTGSTLVVTFVGAHVYTNTILTFKDVTNALISESLASVTGLTNFNASKIVLNNGTLTITLSGSTAHVGDTFTINLATAPEPSALLLLGTGMLAVAGLVRRRVTQPAL